jgi:outer membrane protein
MLRQYLPKLLIASLLIGFQAFLSAQSTTMTLNDCVAYGLANHPNVQVAQLQVNDADWRIKENTATGLPQVTGGVSYQYFIQRPGIPASALGFPGAGDEKVVFSAVHSLSPSLSANQLFFSNSYRLAKKAARFYRQYVDEQLAVSKQRVRNQVIDAYLPALLIAENVAIIDKNLSNLEKLYADTKAINKAGFAEQLDVDRLDLSISTLRSERSNLVRQQEIVLNALKFNMGMPVQNQIALSDNLNKLLGEYASADLVSEVNFMNRPEYLELLKGRELSALQVDLHRKAWMPNIAGFVQYQPGWQGGFGDQTDWFFIPSAVAGLSVNFTLWDGGGAKARQERAVIGVQTIDSQKKFLENAIVLEVENARKQYANATERVSSQQKNLDLAQRIYDTTQKKYKAGVGSSFEISQAEQGLYSAQQALMSAQFDLLTAKVAIKKALGQ